MSRLVFDFDGVLADTSAHALTAANMILNLIDPTAHPFARRSEYRARLDPAMLQLELGTTAAETLTDLHPLLVCRLILRESTPLFRDVVDLVIAAGTRPPIVTAGYELSVASALGVLATGFGGVYGRESGQKEELLERVCTPGGYLITDTVTDVKRCHSLSLSAIGVAWGYDSPEQLSRAGACDVALSADDLRRILSRRCLI